MPMQFSEVLKPHELPAAWGSPAKPDLPLKVRFIYGIGWFILLIVGSLQNNLIIAYIRELQGELGLSPFEASCVSAAYYMGNVWVTVVLFKFRQHYGLRIFFFVIFCILIAVNLLELFYKDFSIILIARFGNGLVGSGLSILTIFYALEMLGAKFRPLMFPLSVGLIQIGAALSRFITAFMSVNDSPYLMNFFETGLVLLAFGVFVLIELPPSRVDKSFYWADFSIIFYAIASAICCFVFSVVTIIWWNYDFIAYLLCIAMICFGVFFIIEYFKKYPFINLKFIFNIHLLEVAICGAFVRMCLAEQTTGAAGLFRDVLGFSDYQLSSYYGVVSLGALCGGILCTLTMQYVRVYGMILSAIGMIVIGSFLSIRLSIYVMPHDLYLGQFLIAAASVFFIGPLMTNGLLLGLARGVNYIMTFAAVFLFSQGVFGLLGSSLINYFIKIRTSQHLQDIINHTPFISNSEVSFHTLASKEAGILAYQDLFYLIGICSLVLFIILLIRYLRFKLMAFHPIGRELKILKNKSIMANERSAKILNQLEKNIINEENR